MDSPSAATQLQLGTMVLVVTLQLQAASCFGLKPLKAARLDASTVWPRLGHCLVDIAAGMGHSSIALIIVCACATPIPQHLPLLKPPPDTPTPPGWAEPSSLALHNSPPRTTRCGLPRDATPPPPLTRTFQAADLRAAFTHTHLRVTNNKESQPIQSMRSQQPYLRLSNSSRSEWTAS